MQLTPSPRHKFSNQKVSQKTTKHQEQQTVREIRIGKNGTLLDT